MAKFPSAKGVRASLSSISINEPSRVDIANGMKIIKSNHPISAIQHDTWNNIPICLQDAMRIITRHIMDADRSNFEYQNKTNERIWKLQQQITMSKKKTSNLEAEVEKDIEKKVSAETRKNEAVHVKLN